MTADEFRRVRRLIAELARMRPAPCVAPPRSPTRAATCSTCGG